MFRAIVEAIENAPLGALAWIVRTRVEEVLAGQLEGDHFAFRIHSPARSGLAVGKRCTITATWTGDGYRVDENQWHGSPHA